MSETTKAERMRVDISDFIDKMRFKHGITYHAIQLGYVENDESKITGYIDGSNSFLKYTKHQLELMISDGS